MTEQVIRTSLNHCSVNNFSRQNEQLFLDLLGNRDIFCIFSHLEELSGKETNVFVWDWSKNSALCTNTLRKKVLPNTFFGASACHKKEDSLWLFGIKRTDTLQDSCVPPKKIKDTIPIYRRSQLCISSAWPWWQKYALKLLMSMFGCKIRSGVSGKAFYGFESINFIGGFKLLSVALCKPTFR